MAVAAAKGLSADVEPQAALRLFPRVASGARPLEEGANVADEVGGVGAKGQRCRREQDRGGRRDGADTVAWGRGWHEQKSRSLGESAAPGWAAAEIVEDLLGGVVGFGDPRDDFFRLRRKLELDAHRAVVAGVADRR